MDINKIADNIDAFDSEKNFNSIGSRPKVGNHSTSSKEDVIEMCQNFLVGMDLIEDFVPGVVDYNTLEGARKFLGKKINNIVDYEFIEKAKKYGFELGDLKLQIEDKSADKSTRLKKSELVVEPIKYSVVQEDDKPKIDVDFGWYKRNIVKLEVPELKEATKYWDRIKLNAAIVDQFLKMIDEMRKDKLLRYIITWNGSYNPRFIRGSKTRLSNHAMGLAFDINAQWNRLGHKPAKESEYGTVIPLIETANAYGFFWGGHYKNRKDGMHFEAKYKVE